MRRPSQWCLDQGLPRSRNTINQDPPGKHGEECGEKLEKRSFVASHVGSPYVAHPLSSTSCCVPGLIRCIKPAPVPRGILSSSSTTVAVLSLSQASRRSLFLVLQRLHDGCRWSCNRGWSHSQLCTLGGPEPKVVQQQASDHSPCLAGASVSRLYC